MSQYEPSEIDPQDDTWEDWSNDEEEQSETQCLFCSDISPNPSESFQHLKTAHNFDFQKVKKSLCLDFYQCIRMINYIRQQVKDNATVALPFTGKEDFFNQDNYLQPVLEDDPLLFAFEELDVEDESQPQVDISKIDLSRVEPATELEKQLLNLLKATQETTTNLEGQFEEYKSMVKKTFFDPLTKSVEDDLPPLVDTPQSIATVVDAGNYYFNSYAHNEIHEQMLKDTARTEAYRDFCYENKDIFKNKVVLDVGCGTGILSMFAARSGAKKVISVDNSAIIEKAKLNIKENGLDDIITCVRGKVEEIEIPVPQVDIIISEWMGYFLLFEAMLDSVLVARDRWLAKDGIMGPSQTRILIAALDDQDLRDDRVNFWNDVYGFKMSAMKDTTCNEAVVDYIRANSVISDVVTIKDLPLQTITIKQLDFVNPFEVCVKRDGSVTAFGGWFDTWFTRDGHSIPLDQEAQKVEGEVYMTTSPFGLDTHWKQTSFMLEKPIAVKAGDKIHGTFTCRKGKENPRELEIEIEYYAHGDYKVQTFYLPS